MLKPRQNALVPPELLVGIDIQIDVMKSIYLLPSLMHRVETLMLASQLREEISSHAGNLNVSVWLVCTSLPYEMLSIMHTSFILNLILLIFYY